MPRIKERLNVTVDPDIARSARRAFKALDMNMSGFVEMSLAMFLQALQPFDSLFEKVESGELDPAAMKAAMRAFQAHSSSMIGAQLVEFGKVQQELSELIEENSTDKK